MKQREIALMLLVLAATAGAQGRSARPTVTLRVSGQNVSSADSSGALAALRRGLEADSLVQFVDQAPAPASPGRGAKFVVAALLRRTGDVVVLDTRTFEAQTSNITGRTSTTAAVLYVGDSAAAIGRRIARTLAVKQP